jgi:hypothetical protein
VCFAHKPGAEAKFDVINAFPFRIFHVFVGYPPAGIQVMENRSQVLKTANKIHQAGGFALYHHIWPQ